MCSRGRGVGVWPPSSPTSKKNRKNRKKQKKTEKTEKTEQKPIEQDTIDYVSVAYLRFTMKFPRKNLHFFHLYFMQLFSADPTFKKVFAQENMKKPPSKVAHNCP